MSLSDRDRKILIGVVPLLVLVAYWFLLFSPKREEAATAANEATEQEQRRDAARAQLRQANSAKTDFAAEYGEIVRLGKAIPAKVDMPSLLVQLDRAADGTGINFTKITVGERVSATPAAAPAPNGDGSGSSEPPTAAGGEQAQSAPGAATEAANNTAATANQQADAADQSGVDSTTSTSAREGGLPVGGGAGPAAAGTPAPSSPAGLETVPLQLEFVGDFFRVADFFHDVKRFVHLVNNDVLVDGRLLTIETVNFTSDSAVFPNVKAELGATIYLSPATEGATAGATPQGPAATTPASGGSAPATPAPTAAATP